MDSTDESDTEVKRTRRRHHEHNKKCPVKDCKSESRNGVKFFNFPKDKKIRGRFSPLAKLWCFFTRIKDFQPICTQAMCELHFSEKCVTVSRKGDGKKFMKAKSVPTIYYSESGDRIEVPYDQENMEYYGPETEAIEQEINASAILHHQEIVSLRQKRMQEIRNLCRFCFSNRTDIKCLEMSKLETYSIDPLESLKTVGISAEYSKAFNDIICGNCFEKVIDFENYRKRCQNAQNELIREMEELDRKVEAAREAQKCGKLARAHKNDSWYSVKVENDPKVDNFDTEGDTDVEAFDTGNDFGNDDDDNFFNASHDDAPLVFNESKEDATGVCQITIKNEPEFAFNNNVAAMVVDEEEIIQSPPKKRKSSARAASAVSSKRAKVDDEPSTSAITATIESNAETAVENESQQLTEAENAREKPQQRERKKKRMFECFFCRLKFVGLRKFNTHECTVKRVKCEVEGCDSYFINQGGYNQHIFHRHNLPKVSKNFCPVCHTCYQMNAVQFDEHCKKCIEVNEYREQQIQCVQCKKICDNLQSYTAHIMLHDTRDLKPVEVEEKSKSLHSRKNKRGKEDKMCDLCGKVFDSSGLQRHKLNVHFVNFTGEMYYCDLCPIAKPTKRLLYNHMKGTHIIKWHACETCGKMFRNRELWRKHQLIHGDFKKNNRCDVCPHRPGFVTKAALNKHMRSNHGGAQPVRKFTCDICKASYSRDDLLIRHRANVHQIYKNNYTDEIINQYIKY